MQVPSATADCLSQTNQQSIGNHTAPHALGGNHGHISICNRRLSDAKQMAAPVGVIAAIAIYLAHWPIPIANSSQGALPATIGPCASDTRRPCE